MLVFVTSMQGGELFPFNLTQKTEEQALTYLRSLKKDFICFFPSGNVFDSFVPPRYRNDDGFRGDPKENKVKYRHLKERWHSKKAVEVTL